MVRLKMKTITERFLAYRKQAPKETTPPPATRKMYEHTGFLNATETTMERMGRLVEARARGFKLSLDDWRFFRNNRSLHPRKSIFRTKACRQFQRQGRNFEFGLCRVFRESVKVYRG